MARYVGVNLKIEYADAIDSAIVDDPLIKTRAEFVRLCILKELRNRGERQ